MSILALATVVLAGCPAAPKLVPVSGTITVNGEPLVAGTVVLEPDASKGNTNTVEPRGTITPEGKYRVSVGRKEGAPLGWYRVAIYTVRQPTPDEMPKPPEWLANHRFSDGSTSGLVVKVVENPSAGAYDFNLEP